MADIIPNIPVPPNSEGSYMTRLVNSLRDWVGKLSADGGLLTHGGLTRVLPDVLAGMSGLSPLLVSVVPPQLQNLVVTGAFRSIMLEWDDPRYAYLAYVEIWRAESDDLALAVKISGTPANLYADVPEVSSLAKEYWYWVRAVSKAGVIGPYNATAGTMGSTANDPSYILQLLSNNAAAAQFAVPGEEPFYVLTATTVINGQTVPAGIYVNAANIVDLTSANIRAGGIVADRLTVSKLSAISANMGDITAGSIDIGSGKFKVNSQGDVEIKSSATGARMEVKNNVIKVFDSAGTLRVKIGDLSA
jgi:hypothetical protein